MHFNFNLAYVAYAISGFLWVLFKNLCYYKFYKQNMQITKLLN